MRAHTHTPVQTYVYAYTHHVRSMKGRWSEKKPESKINPDCDIVNLDWDKRVYLFRTAISLIALSQLFIRGTII